MRAAKSLNGEDRRRRRVAIARRLATSAASWAAAALALGALLWLLWPASLVPGVLRHHASATAFVQVLWQVDAAALALSTAVITFAFAAFNASRVAELGGSLPWFARASGLLGVIAVGLVAIAACGGALLVMPPSSWGDALQRYQAAAALAAVVISGGALTLIPVVLKQSLLAGDRVWLARQHRARITHALDQAVARFIENDYARVILSDVRTRHGIGLAPPSHNPGWPYHAGRHPRMGVLVDIRLRRLVRLQDIWSGGVHPAVLISGLMLFDQGVHIASSDVLLWVAGPIAPWEVRRIFKLHRDRPERPSAGELDSLHASAMRAVRDDDEVSYREAAGIQRDVMAHLIGAWRVYGAAPGRAPNEDQVGLTPLSDHLEAQVLEIIALDRRELTHAAIDVPISVGLEASYEGPVGAGLAARMLELLTRIVNDAIPRVAEPTARQVHEAASSGVFMLLRAITEPL